MKKDNFNAIYFFPFQLTDDYFFVHSLYESAFPPYERRSWEQLLHMLPQENMKVIVAQQEEGPVGFAIYWEVEGWYFLEHLAIHPSVEGRGYGRIVMQYLIQKSGSRLLLETELPTDEISRRRIRFYKNAGLQIVPFPYQQPPYRKGETTPAMHIMSVPVITNEADFTSITTILRKQIFEAFY